jgi:hypothetical protein
MEVCQDGTDPGFDSLQLDADLEWGERRFNSAAAAALAHGWIWKPYRKAAVDRYILPFAYLSEEAEFFLE